MKWGIWAKVGGGQISYRELWLKTPSKEIKLFDEQDKAVQEAINLNNQTSQYNVGNNIVFNYSAERYS